MQWKLEVDHEAASAIALHIIRALETDGSVLLDPQSCVTLALAYRHKTEAHELILEDRGHAFCTCRNWFYEPGLMRPYHDHERIQIYFDAHIDDGKQPSATAVSEQLGQSE